MNPLQGISEYRSRLKEVYRHFFVRMDINPDTGDLPPWFSQTQKFACYPYIGSLYGYRRLLVVGLEVAHDNPAGDGIQSFEGRRRAIEDKRVDKHNPHIAGTYFTALRYGHPEIGWDRFADSQLSCEKILKSGEDLPRTNPLSLIALTNFYKWVTKGARRTAGTRDRVNFARELEEELFAEEVRILEPEVVVFQGREYAEPRFRRMREWVERMVEECYVVYHPSNRMRNGRLPRNVVHPIHWCEYSRRVEFDVHSLRRGAK